MPAVLEVRRAPAEVAWRPVDGGPTTTLLRGDGVAWLAAQPPRSVHAIVTDPPYGLREFGAAHAARLQDPTTPPAGSWRVPPAIGGTARAPVPRFTELRPAERAALEAFFAAFAAAAARALVPGGHLLVATTPVLSHHAYGPLLAAGLEKRAEVVRLVQTLRGGDRPKGAEAEFPDATVIPRGAWEPWGVFRAPLEPGATVAATLRRWGAGALRRCDARRPFTDVVRVGPAGRGERALAPHPALKPQALMRQLVRAALPLGRGRVVDPFAGSGATLAAALALGYEAVGLEVDAGFYSLAVAAVPKLAALEVAAGGG